MKAANYFFDKETYVRRAEEHAHKEASELAESAAARGQNYEEVFRKVYKKRIRALRASMARRRGGLFW